MAIDLWQTGIKVLVVYPGLVDTELFSLPDNDPVMAGVEAVPVSELVGGVFDALDAVPCRSTCPAISPTWPRERRATSRASCRVRRSTSPPSRLRGDPSPLPLTRGCASIRGTRDGLAKPPHRPSPVQYPTSQGGTR